MEAAAKRDTRTPAQRNHDALVAFLRPEMGPTKLGKHRGLGDPGGGFDLGQAHGDDRGDRPAWAHSVMWCTAVMVAGALQPGRVQPRSVAINASRCAEFASRSLRPRCNGMPAWSKMARNGLDCCANRNTSSRGRCRRRRWCPTDIDNLTLACDACHAMIHDGPGGWKTVVMPPDSEHAGRTGWIAPPHIDPTRTPQVNDRHHAGELMAAKLAQIRDRTRPPLRWWSRP